MPPLTESAASLTIVVMVLLSTAVGVRGHEQANPSVSPTDTIVYVGTYTGGKTNSRGIYAFKMQGGSAALVPLGLVAETTSPSYIEIDADRGLLFAVNETEEYEGKPTGFASAFSIDRKTGKLTLINRQPTEGKAPCHLALDKSRRHLIIANYTSGTVTVLPVAADGRLGPASAVVQHTGSSVDPRRQAGPHAHCTTFDPAYRLLFACDLGLDKVMAYQLDPAKGTLTAYTPPSASVKPGSGPRHMDFRPDARFAYVLNEMASTVTTFAYDAKAGSLAERQTVSTLPPSFSGSNSGAEIVVHPSGKFVYSSNRGHNSIALFRIDPTQGTLTFVEAQDTGGRTPRNFAIDPAGRLLFAANQDSGTMLVFTIDQATGQLKPSGPPIEVPSPVCVRFLGSVGVRR
jgi:6-phosphogluconolactonase